MTLIAYAFPKLQTPTNVVNKRLKSPVSEALREATWQGGPNTAENRTIPSLRYLLIIMLAIEFEKISHSDMQSLRNVC